VWGVWRGEGGEGGAEVAAWGEMAPGLQARRRTVEEAGRQTTAGSGMGPGEQALGFFLCCLHALVSALL